MTFTKSDKAWWSSVMKPIFSLDDENVFSIVNLMLVHLNENESISRVEVEEIVRKVRLDNE